MNRLKKAGFILAMALIATSCRKNEEEVPKPVEEMPVIEVEKPIEAKDEYKVKAMTFGSQVVLEQMNNEDNISIKAEADPNFTNIENGDFDIAIVPAYLGPYFYNKTNQGIKLAAITQTGNLYMVSDKKINGQMDYRGKNFLVPDPVGNLAKIVDSKVGPLNLILRLNMEYYKSMEDIYKKMETAENYVALLSDPYYTKALRNTLYVSDVQDLLPIGEGEFLSEIIIVNNDYLANNEDKFNEFLDSYQLATSKISEKAKISDRVKEKYDMTDEELKLAIDRMNLSFIDGDTMKGAYQVFLDRLSQVDESILGKNKVGDDFFYLESN